MRRSDFTADETESWTPQSAPDHPLLLLMSCGGVFLITRRVTKTERKIFLRKGCKIRCTY